MKNGYETIRTQNRKKAALLFAVAVLLAGGAAAVRGQSALDGFDPNANNLVLALVVQPDGKILIGGGFTTLSPNGGAAVTRNRIARLNPDGTLDTAFNPNASSDVNAIALQADGKILVGGFFTSVGGQTRNRIARLNLDGTLDTAFNPNASGSVRAIALQTDGRILAGGQFTSIGGQTRNRIARLSPDGTLDTAFNPNANSTVFSIVVQADGKILVGGFFNGANSIGGQTRNRIARLDPTTGLPDSFNPNASDGVYAIAVQADGNILAGGDFNGANSIGGQTRNRIARLDATTGLADAFNPNANFGVFTITVQPDGRILAGGDFTGASSIGGASRNTIARLDPITGAADSFDPHANVGASVYAIVAQPDNTILVGGNFNTLAPNGGAAVTRNAIARLETDGRLDQTLPNLGSPDTISPVFATTVQADGKILLGGHFTSIGAQARNNIARLNTDGTLDATFNPNADREVRSIAVQADGKILVGGDFTSLGGQTRNGIARLNANGTLDTAFNPNVNEFVLTITPQADGKILVGGQFTAIGGQTRNHIARLNSDGTLDAEFNPNANDDVDAIAVQADGKILVGGFFDGTNSIGGQTRDRIARLDPTTGLADSFNPSANFLVESIAVQTDGKILAGGRFTSIGGQARNRIARLNPDGTPDIAFNPNADGDVESIALQADGRILAGGVFKSIGGQTRNRIARLDATTGAADSFDPNADFPVHAIAIQADGKILVGGLFSTIAGQTRSYFARLSHDTAALQNLAVMRNTITWTRGGSSPQFGRVTFEHSTDNVSYNFLGNGTASGRDWTLTGSSFPTAQNFYIRARGYCRIGQFNGSEGIAESVRNAFIVSQPLLTIQRSGNTDLALSWATNFTGFTLEANTNLNTNDWSVVSPAPTVSGTNNVVTNAASGSARFYRLRE